ncbi:hypothetical protein HYW75_05990, partial [Candidatus Pacearchaeota archaeon]|nr:hypothetical protein [Candidatus Pacearchaeota archaeon]
EGLKKLLSDGGINQFILKKVPVGHALVFPMCEKCHTSNPVTPKYEDGKIFTSCSNPDCDIEKYEVDILDTSRDLAVHFFIDPIRDKTVKPNANIHVFGGDYSAVHDHANGDSTDFLYTKVGKVIELMRRVSKDIPDFLVGPTFYARDGNKMSKSKDNGLRIERLKEYYGNGYVEKVVDFISYVADRGFKHIDYQVLEQKLFG